MVRDALHNFPPATGRQDMAIAAGRPGPAQMLIASSISLRAAISGSAKVLHQSISTSVVPSPQTDTGVVAAILAAGKPWNIWTTPLFKRHDFRDRAEEFRAKAANCEHDQVKQTLRRVAGSYASELGQ